MTRQLTKWIGDLAVTTAKLANNAVTSAKIATSAIGSGLAGGGGSPVSLNIDGLTNESSVDSVNDYAAFYDASAGAVRKTAIENIGGGGGGDQPTVPPGLSVRVPNCKQREQPDLSARCWSGELSQQRRYHRPDSHGHTYRGHNRLGSKRP